MRAEECRQWRERIGALLLGQLPEEERFATEAHLDGCPACRAEAQALTPAASLLARADPEHLVPAPAPPSRVRERIFSLIGAERRAERRRRTRLRLGLAAAAAASAAAVVVIIIIMPGPDRSAPAETVAFRSLPRGAFAEATLAPRPWGSEVSVKVYGFRRGTQCQVWLRRSDGRRVPAGSFRYVYEGEGDHLSTAVPPRDATAIGLRIGSKTFVAPLPSRSAGAGAWLIPSGGPTTPQEDI
jgi:anti-sigma factor RsiW